MTAQLKGLSADFSLSNNQNVLHGNDFLCVLSPKAPLSLSNQEGNIRLFLTVQQQVYSLTLTPNLEINSDKVLLYFDIHPAFFDLNQIDSSCLSQLQKRPLFYRELVSLKALIEAGNQHNLLRQTSIIYQLLTDIIDMQKNEPVKESRQKNKDNLIFNKVDDLLTRNLYGTLPTINTIAASVGISGSKLKIMYQRQYNTGLYQHYLNLKFEAAKELLRHYSVGATAQLVGFKVTSKFIVGFKKRYGITPFKYKQSMLY